MIEHKAALKLNYVLSRSTNVVAKLTHWGLGFLSEGASISSITIAAALFPISWAGISMEVMEVSSIPPTAWPVRLMTFT